jgi:hypothetical protein
MLTKMNDKGLATPGALGQGCTGAGGCIQG